MSLTAAAIRALADKGLSACDIADIAEANTPTQSAAAVRQKRYRDNKRDVTRDVTPPLNEYISKPLADPVEAKASTSPFGEKLVSAWNDGPAKRGARKATKLDASRRQLLTARLRDHSEDEVLAAVANLAASKFHCGTNDRGWRVNLGWMLKAENFLKVLEMGDERATAAPVDMAEYRATLDRLAARGFGGGEECASADRPPGPPRPFGQLAAGIASAVPH